MNKELLNNFANEIWDAAQKSKSVCILTHKNPDGDGLPAAMALQEILKLKDVKADVVLEELIPDSYYFLDGNKRTLVYSDEMDYETVILVDCHEADRVGKCAPLIKKASNVFTIDHHIESKVLDFANNLILPECVSAGVIVFNLFEKNMDVLSDVSKKYVGDCIYTTILNDTDGFINANVSPHTFEVASKLMTYGMIPGKIAESFLMNRTVDEMKFIGATLSLIETHFDGRILFMYSTLKMLDDLQLTSHATSKLTGYVKGIKGVQLVVYFSELEPNYFRLNLRSNVINVNKIATVFDGGGHKNASGCRMYGSLEEIEKKILKEIEKQL